MDPFEYRSGLPGSPRLDQLVNEDGTSWLNFRKTLAPNFRRVWADIALCYVMIVGGYAGLWAAFWQLGLWMSLAVALPVSALIGFWLHALCNFGHEAVHYNIAADRKRNDLLANRWIWPFFGQTTRSYRDFHWQHHVHLGDHQDTEISYHNCLSPWFLTRLVTGLYLIELVFRYTGKRPRATDKNDPADERQREKSRQQRWALIRTALLHCCLTGVPLLFGFWTAAAGWAASVLVFFPAWNSLRQILEHRRETATCKDDFTQEEHGPSTYWFGKDFFSRYFGAAEWNGDIFHHWDPSVSYTRFDAMESFLRRTPLSDRVDEMRRSYASALFRAIWVATRG